MASPTQTVEDRGRAKSGRYDVFISYSRVDRPFVVSLNDALERRDREAWVDWEGIPPTAEWMAEIHTAIEAADTFVLVMSPTSMSSKVCGEEIAHALAFNKRVIPLVHREVDAGSIPDAVRSLNWIFFRDQDDFEHAVEKVIQALDTDLDYVRTHTRLLVRAREWDSRERGKSLLLRGSELASAEHWLGQQSAAKHPQPTPLHAQYITASRKAATVLQRVVVLAAVLAVLVSSALAVIAWGQRNQAVTQRELAQKQQRISFSRELAVNSGIQLSIDPELGLTLAVKAGGIAQTQEAQSALRQALIVSHERAILRPQVTPDSLGYRFFDQATFSPDGNLAVTVTDKATQIWSVDTSRIVATIGSQKPIYIAHISPDARLVLTTDAKGRTRLWETATGELVRTVTKRGALWSSFSPNGASVVTVDTHHMAKAWSAATGGLLKGSSTAVTWASGSRPRVPLSPDGEVFRDEVWDKDSRTINYSIYDTETGKRLWGAATDIGYYSYAFSPDGTLYAAADGRVVRVRDTRTGKQVATLRGSSDQTSAVTFSPDGKLVAAGSFSLDGAVRVWRASTGSRVAVMKGHTGDTPAVAFSPDSEVLATAASDNSARLWEVRSGKSVGSLTGHTGTVQTVGFNRDGTEVITASQDGTVRVWDATQALPTATLHGARHRSHSRATLAERQDFWSLLGRDDELFLTRGPYHTVRLVDTDTGTVIHTLRGHQGPITNFEFSPDAKLVVTSSDDHTARVWDAATGKPVSVIRQAAALTDAQFSPNGTSVLTIPQRGPPHLWDSKTGEPTGVLRGSGSAVVSAQFSPNGERVVATDSTGMVRLWQVADGANVATLAISERTSFSPDGELVLTVSEGRKGTAQTWDATTGERLTELGTGKVFHEIFDGVFSPDGQLLVTYGGEYAARVWDPTTGTGLASLRRLDQVLGAAFSADGSQLATFGSDHTIRLWDPTTHKLRAVLRGHTSDVYTADFDPTGQYLVSSADDGSIRIWDVTTRQTLMTIPYQARLQDASFTPAGQYVMVTDVRGTARLYECEVCTSFDELLALGSSRLTRPLTAEQKRVFLHQ